MGENNLVDDALNKESWSVVKVLRGHLEDIYDLCWSCDSCYIISGSVDNSAIVWDVQKGTQVVVLKESKQYVQGVSWDPLGKFVATISNDRNLRIYGIESKFKCLHSITKLSLPEQNGDSKQWKMWTDERLNSFFRRLSFTPDGLFLIVPAGRYEFAGQSKNATYVFARNDWSRPVLQLPGPEKPTVVVKCCPIPYELMLNVDSSLTSLPYRFVYAVASLDAILFYDTQHSAPFAHVSNIHYSGITDISWSNDGMMLIVTSSDCYCSIITFEHHELGIPMDSSAMFKSVEDSNNTGSESAFILIPQDSSPNGKLFEQDNGPSGKPCEEASSPSGKPCEEGGSPSGKPCEEANSPSGKPCEEGGSPSGKLFEQVNGPSGKPRRIRPTMISTIAPDNVEMRSNDHESEDIVSTMSKTEAMETTPVSSEMAVNDKPIPRRVDFITLSSFKKPSVSTKN